MHTVPRRGWIQDSDCKLENDWNGHILRITVRTLAIKLTDFAFTLVLS